MKISKLFHWLYAVLMFLPLLVFLPTGFYYAFNDNAQSQQYIKEEPVYYQTNEVSSIDDLSIGKVYRWNDNYNNSYIQSNYLFLFAIEKTDNLTFLPNFDDMTNIRFLFTPTGALNLYCQYSDNTSYSLGLGSRTLDFVVKNYDSNFQDTNEIISHFSSSSILLVKEYQEVTYTMGIVDSMSNAWEHTWDMPLFSWSELTFLNAPFNYITELFSIPNGSTFSNAFGYWLSISICWLVFDVIMYVPMLVHRWIDKARIE